MTDTSKATQPETVVVNDIDHFIALLFAWHTNKVTLLQHLASVPEGTQMMVGEDEPITLSGDVLAGFKAGLEMALMELGTLPFAAEVDEEPTAANDAG